MDQERIVVTGSAGFIGSHLVRHLVARGVDVLGLDNFDPFYDPAIKQANQKASHAAADASDGSYTFHELELAEPGAFSRAAKDFRPTGVIHLAGKAGVRPSIADPAGYARANVVATSEVLSGAHEAGCARVVLASSSSVYGNSSSTPFSEEDTAVEPISPYAATKRSCELLAHTHHHLTGQPVSCLRFFTVFGPRQRPDLAIAMFMRRIDAGEPITVFGDGSTSRDYTFIGDIVSGICAAYEKTPEFGFRIWNLGSDRPVRLDELIASIAEVVGKDPVIHREGMQPGDVDRTWADLSRARTELGYAAKTPLSDALRAQWEAYAGSPS